jgi:hypothetical protein
MASSLADFTQAYAECGTASVGRFAASLDPTWIDDALAATGTASIRRRKLTADRALWLVLGMCLFVDRSIDDVVAKLELQMLGMRRVAPSALPQATRTSVRDDLRDHPPTGLRPIKRHRLRRDS